MENTDPLVTPQDSEEEEEGDEEEVTDSREDDPAFDGCAFEAILKRAGASEQANFSY